MIEKLLMNYLKVGDLEKFNTLLEMQEKTAELLQDSSFLKDMVNNAASGTEETLLHVAAEKGFLTITAKLIKLGANVNLISSHGRITPLYNATIHKQIEIVKFLIDSGANVNFVSDEGFSCLCIAVIKQCEEIVKIIIESKKVNVNEIFQRNCCTALHLAVRFSNVKIIRMLIEAGADTNLTSSKNNESPLHTAIELGNQAIIELLLDSNADVHSAFGKQGITPIHQAAKKKNVKLTKLLLDRGANVNAKMKDDNCGYLTSPLHLACLQDEIDIVKLLINAGADVNATLNKANNFVTPLHVAIHKNNIAVALLLIDSGADLGLTDINMNTPLLCAAALNRKEILEKLISEGAKIEAVNNNEDSALHLSVANNCKEVVQLLLSSGANINCINKQRITPLHIATIQNNKQIMFTLLEKKPNLNVREIAGETPLEIALRLKQEDIVSLLINTGCSFKSFYHPLFAAINSGKLNLTKAILNASMDADFFPLDPANKSSFLYHALALGHKEIALQLFDFGFGLFLDFHFDKDLKFRLDFTNKVVIGMKINGNKVTKKTPEFENAITNIEEYNEAIKKGVCFNQKGLHSACNSIDKKSLDSSELKILREFRNTWPFLPKTSLINLCLNTLNKSSNIEYRKACLHKESQLPVMFKNQLNPDLDDQDERNEDNAIKKIMKSIMF